MKECLLDSSQQFSLQGKWGTTPVRVAFHVNDFDSTEISEFQKGGKSWNTFFNSSKGFAIFDLGPDNTGNVATANQTTPTCNSGTLSDGTIVYKRSSNWPHSNAAIAVTSTCFNDPNNGSLATLFNAIMEFNYVNFFSGTATRFPDMESIALHELGHLLGLDHSCGPLGRPNQNKANVACPDPSTDPSNSLIATVMFPQVFFDPTGAGEQKRTLTDNDQGRANCLY